MSVVPPIMSMTLDGELLAYINRKLVLQRFANISSGLDRKLDENANQADVLKFLKLCFLQDYNSLPSSYQLEGSNEKEPVGGYSYQFLSVVIEFFKLTTADPDTQQSPRREDTAPTHHLNGVYKQLQTVILSCEDEEERKKLEHLRVTIDGFYESRKKPETKQQHYVYSRRNSVT